MVIVAFPPGEKYAVNYTTLDQYDYGQILRIQGLKLPKTVEVHFSTQETGGASITRVGVTKDGVTDVLIPDSVLENGDTTQNYSIFAFVYITDATSGKTEYRARLEVKARPKPEVPGGGDNPDIFHEAVLEVRKSAEKAEEAQRQAEGWAHGREDLPERAEDNAMYYAGKASEDAKKTAQDRAEVERLVESVSGIDEQVAKVEKLSKDAQEAATQAGTSAEQAELHKQAAETAKESVENLSAQVQKNKESVDKTAQDFALNTQQALADVNNAGQAQTERVQTAGTTAVENIKTAQNTATQAVETAKAEAIKAVQTEGTTQTGNVTAEGEKQVQAVQTAAQEIIADRKQIAKNKTDIADLRQKKADAIIETASGTLLNVKDSSGAFFENFSMSGKTTQDGTPTPDAPVEIVNAGEDGNIENKVTGKNLWSLGDVSFNGYKELSVNYPAGNYVLSFDVNTPASSMTVQVGINIDGNWKYNQVKKDNRAAIKISSATGITAVRFYAGDSPAIKDNAEYYNIQIEKRADATVFEPYKEPQTLILQLDRPLTKWDRLEKREGVWGIVRQNAKKVLNGTENITRYAPYTGEKLKCYQFPIADTCIGFKNSFCTHFKNVDRAWDGKIGIEPMYSDHMDNMYKYFISDKPTVEEFKAWLAQQKEAGIPIELVYKTAEETWEPLPEEMQLALNALHTNYPTTVVSNSEDTEMELTYVADTKNYTDNKIKEAVTAQTQSLANLLSLMPLSTQAAMIEADTNNILDNMEVQK